MTQKMGNSNGSSSEGEHVVNFQKVREQRLEEKRKNTERIFFKSLLSVYSVVGRSKILPIEIIEISEEGCSFQITESPKSTWPETTENLPIRLYFSQDTYLEVLVNIQNSKKFIENQVRYIRFGCKLDKTLKSYGAYQSFVRFLKCYAESAHKDMGDVSIFYI